MPTIAGLNGLPPAEARADLLRCCGSGRWADAMVAARPFADEAALLSAADRADALLGREDWLEAFSHHPKIGDRNSLRKKFAATAAWAAGEQAGAAAASEEILDRLARGNEAYHAKFGHIFIVCATGKSAAEMLALLETRLPNESARELPVAAAEQAKITRIRLRKLIAMSTLSTHVLDTARGRPAEGVPIVLETLAPGGSWAERARGVTNADGRVKDLLPPGNGLETGIHRLTFDTAAYFAATGQTGFYPHVAVVFEVREVGAHYHVPLLVSPYGYSTYRGS